MYAKRFAYMLTYANVFAYILNVRI
jgi:hypothetical protein